MRILTGNDRLEFERVLIRAAAQAAELDMLRIQNNELQKVCQGLRKDLERERARADRAVDALLAVRGFPTVTPREGMPDLPDVLQEDPEAVAEIEKRMSQGDSSVFTERR